jgi:predicted ATPase
MNTNDNASGRPILRRLQLAGFKSIRNLDLELGRINVLIGANGAGKSNLFSLFKLLDYTIAKGLRIFVASAGSTRYVLHYGPSHTSELTASLEFEYGSGATGATYLYAFRLVRAAGDTLVYADESVARRCAGESDAKYPMSLGAGHAESRLGDVNFQGNPAAVFIKLRFDGWKQFHFHSTAPDAPPRQFWPVADNHGFRSDGGNIAPFLFRLQSQYPEHYRQIRDVVRQVAGPFFSDFLLKPSPENLERMRLDWREPGPDAVFGPDQLSDGTLRFICLATLLLQPEPPELIIIDEPELGLHPYAINLLAEMVRIAAAKSQIILATQSVTLLEHFEPEDVIVVERNRDERGYAESTFRRLEPKKLESWLGDYSLGELWEKNVVGGRPHA